MNQLSKMNKDVKKSSAEVEPFTGNYLYLKKTINPVWASFFIVSYTVFIAFGTSFLIDSKTEDYSSAEKLSDIRNELLDEIRKSKAPVIVNDVSAKNDMEKMRAEIIDEVNRINLKYLDIIESNKKKYTSVISAVSAREPASVISAGKKVVPFNNVNEEVLLFKHQKLYQREKEKLKMEEKIAINALDLTNSSGIEKMKQIQDNTEVALFELKKRLFYKRQEFRKDKYIVMND